MISRIFEAEGTKLLLAGDKVQGSYPLGDIKGFDMIALIGTHAGHRREYDKRDDEWGTLTRGSTYMGEEF
ncbi:hypothetical protein N7476_010331 [Penicillium atrosanguineum]|uniref:Uncharacterized protein n=1 Tax=Penicillium atrosanguineum TaxID=1132637 RepID=A0A9W9PQ23_9EURO|nr:hypothetical protein N7476_010331 [Penicillium atrosanguineum]